MTRVVDVAQAVTDELNGESFSQAFTATRQYLPVFDLQEMAALHVTVVPKSVETTSFDRGRYVHDITVDVAVQKKLTGDDTTDVDPLMALVQEIAEHFQEARLLAAVQAVLVRVENAPVYAQEHMHEKRQFTSLLSFTFRLTS